jgi:hypothetical protein
LAPEVNHGHFLPASPSRYGERLAAQLCYARDHVPYYQTSLPAAPITAANAVDVLHTMPTLRRKDVHANRPRLWSAEGDATAWRTVRTTGMTGNPVEVVIDGAAQQAELDALRRHVTGLVPHLAGSDYSVFHLTLHASARTRAAESAPVRLVKWNLTRAWRLPDERLAECLREVDGHVVTTMPSVAAALVDRVRGVRPALIVLSGEPFTESLRESLGEIFGCPVTSMYTLAEMGIAGVECETSGGYHVSDDILVELIDGRVTMTSLVNRAMPLIRYETGDGARWDDHACRCTRREPLLRLTRTRPTHVLVQAGERRLTLLDLAKLFAQLDVREVTLTPQPGGVVVRYRGAALPETTTTAVAAAIRGLLGPSTVVDVQCTESPHTETLDAAKGASPALQEPDPEVVAEWARTRLREVPGVRAAALCGSVLSPETFTRYSDIDLTILVDDEHDLRWPQLARSMHRHMTGLRVNVSSAAALTDAPLVRARLLAEHHPVLGKLTEIAWPTPDEAAAEARFWAQDAKAILWTQLTAPDPPRDSIRTAWHAARFSLDGLRYRYLARGERATAAADVLAKAATEHAPTLDAIHTALDIATEHRPPRPGDSERLLTGALSTVAWMRRGLDAAK